MAYNNIAYKGIVEILPIIRMFTKPTERTMVAQKYVVEFVS